MAADLLTERIRIGVNSRDLNTPYEVLGSKNDTVGRLRVAYNGFGTAADGPFVSVGHARGTVDAPANVVDGDNLGDFEFYAYAGGWQQAAEIRSHVTGAVADGVTPSTNMTFKVATGGAMVIRFQLFSTGRSAFGSASRATEADAAANGAGALWVGENNNQNIAAFHYSGNDALGARIYGRKSRGASMSAPANVQNGDVVWELQSQSYSGGWFDGAEVHAVIDAAPVNGQAPATRLAFRVNANNAAVTTAMQIKSDLKFIMGASMTNFTDAKFNYNLAGAVDEIAATWGQTGGFPNTMIFGFSTYSSGYTNGHPARIYVQDNSFSCSIRFDHKKTGASSNTLVPSLLLIAASNAANAAFFSNAGSFGNGQGVIFIANRDTAPTANPTGGGILYAEAGALKWRGSAGTITTIANA